MASLSSTTEGSNRVSCAEGRLEEEKERDNAVPIRATLIHRQGHTPTERLSSGRVVGSKSRVGVKRYIVRKNDDCERTVTRDEWGSQETEAGGFHHCTGYYIYI